MQNRRDFPTFSREAGEINRLIAGLPRFIANTLVNFYTDSWTRRGYIDTSFRPWKPRKRQGKDSNRALLVRRGHLRQSLHATITPKYIVITAAMPYAEAHNEGSTATGVANVRAHERKPRRTGRGGQKGTVMVKAHSRTFKMNLPQRQFMDIPGRSPSAFVMKRIEANIDRQLRNIFK